MARNPSHKTYRNRFKQHGRELAVAAKGEQWRAALRLCVEEIEQFHARAYPDCKGECPARHAIAEARKALA